MKKKTKKILIIVLSVMLIGLVLASASIFGKDDWNNLKDKFNDLTQQEEVVVESKNALKNSDFSINTKEITVFDETVHPVPGSTTTMIDNWYLNKADGQTASDEKVVKYTAYQTEDGLYFKNTGDYDLSLQQVIEEGVVKYANKEMTLSISIDDVVYTATGVLSGYHSISIKIGTLQSAYATVLFSQNSCNVQVDLKAGSNVTINWVQLEEGNVFTGYNG